ncbi:Uncharacterised protein [Bordetella pertussis]|nr:Uncharacterised protein [Bordetella pertussis]
MVVTASGRSLPAFRCGSDSATVSNMMSTWPPSRSATAGAAPL